MRRRAWAAALLVAAVPTAAMACRCGPTFAAGAYRLADAVVLARVEKAEGPVIGRRYQLRVRESWKRRQPADLAIFGSANTCAQPLEPGREYLLYLEAKPDGRFTTDRCAGNLPAAEAGARLRSLGKPARG